MLECRYGLYLRFRCVPNFFVPTRATFKNHDRGPQEEALLKFGPSKYRKIKILYWT